MFRHPGRIRAISLGFLLLSTSFTLLLTGCGRKTSPASMLSPDDPSGAAEAQALSIRNPQDVARAIQVQEQSTLRLMAMPGVIGTGTGATADGRPAIVVLMQHAGARDLPAQIGGIPVEARVIGTVVAYANLQMGTSTSNDQECAAGTLGCVVTRDGTEYFLSNNHVFARENSAAIGERIDAPGRYDARSKCAQTAIAARLSAFVKIQFGGSNTVDCAIARPDPGRAYTKQEAAGYKPVTSITSPSVGLAVKKTGRTSGLTHGSIQAINVTVQVQYGNGQVATFRNQIMTPASFIRAGDSGSLMVTESGNRPVGLCFAGGSGGSFANPIGPVLKALGVSIAP